MQDQADQIRDSLIIINNIIEEQNKFNESINNLTEKESTQRARLIVGHSVNSTKLFEELKLNQHIQFVDAHSGDPNITPEGIQIITAILQTNNKDLIEQLGQEYISIFINKKNSNFKGDNVIAELNTLVARRSENETLNQFSKDITITFEGNRSSFKTSLSATPQGMAIIRQIFDENDLIKINALAQIVIEQMRAQYLKQYDLKETANFPVNSENIKDTISNLKQLLSEEDKKQT